MRKRMVSMDTANEITIPIISIANSAHEKTKPNLTSLNRLAPIIVGMARKNENSAAAFLDTPISSAPAIVAPEREVPGIMASDWNNPIRKAVL